MADGPANHSQPASGYRPRYSSLDDYLQVLRRRRWLILALTVVGAAIGVALAAVGREDVHGRGFAFVPRPVSGPRALRRRHAAAELAGRAGRGKRRARDPSRGDEPRRQALQGRAHSRAAVRVDRSSRRRADAAGRPRRHVLDGGAGRRDRQRVCAGQRQARQRAERRAARQGRALAQGPDQQPERQGSADEARDRGQDLRPRAAVLPGQDPA